jgi:hypothetical protein
MKINTEEIVNRKNGYLSKAILGSATDEAIASIDRETGDVEIKMTFNGHEIPVEKFFQNLEKQHNRMVGEQAHAMISNELNDLAQSICSKLADIESEVAIELRKKIQVLLPGVEFYWEEE